MNINAARQIQYWQDLSAGLLLGKVKADRRLQVKMPSQVVVQLDALFPDVDRSFVLTQLAVNAIAQELKFHDREALRSLASAEQSGLDDMLVYLEKRDAESD